MKNSITFLFCLAFLLLGCTSTDDFSIVEGNPEHHSVQPKSTISKNEALEIAGRVLQFSPLTRGVTNSAPSFDYVISDPKTRSASQPDTLAYIINYPNDEGFVIVSTLRKVYPVMAYSDRGNFSLENEVAKANFIDKIDSYVSNADDSTIYEVGNHDFSDCFSNSPAIEVSLSQWSPWNKYVVKKHPGCPAGCVAVATALLLSHSFAGMDYHNSKFYFKSILDPINKAQNHPTSPKIIDPNDEWEKLDQPEYTYSQAVDSMAKLLYLLGKDLDMKYAEKSSSTGYMEAYKLCERLLGNIPSGFSPYRISDVCKYLQDDHMVYMDGDVEGSTKGHAWVCDACSFCYSPTNHNQLLDCYIHCNWGWGGSSDGFYSGKVFSTYEYDIKPTYYFAVKRKPSFITDKIAIWNGNIFGSY